MKKQLMSLFYQELEKQYRKYSKNYDMTLKQRLVLLIGQKGIWL